MTQSNEREPPLRETGTVSRAVELALDRVGRPGQFDVRRLLGDLGPEAVAREICRTADVIARHRRVSLAQLADVAGPENVILVPAPDGWLVAQGNFAKWVTGAQERGVPMTPRHLRRIGLPEQPTVIIIEARLQLATLTSDDGEIGPWRRLWRLLRLELADIRTLVAYALVLGGLSLAVPVAAQVLVNTIALGSLLQPLVVLSVLLLGTLVLAGSLQLLQWYAAEVLQRKLFVQVAEDFARRLPTVRYSVHRQHDVREVVNRFFEAAGIQKSAGVLLLDGLALALQTLTGMLLLAFYHPSLLVFDILLVVGLLVVVALGHGSVKTAIDESKAKYRIAAWLENIAARPTLFHRRAAAVGAAVTADKLTREYLRARKRHYAKVFRQLSAGAGLQALAMVALLGLGGYLVIEGELTLGQLVAAELVVGRVAAGFAKLGKHFERFYDLVASLDKIGNVLDLPTDAPAVAPAFTRPHVELEEVVVGGSSNPCAALSVTCRPGQHIWVSGGDGGQRDELFEVLAGLQPPKAGRIHVADVDGERRTSSRDELKEHSLLLLAGELVNGTLAENLRLLSPDATDLELSQALAAVELGSVVDRLPQGLNAPVFMTGAPLTRQQAARLCLARLYLTRPTLAILGGIIDDADFSPVEKQRVLDWVFAPDAPWTAIVTSHDPDIRRRCKQDLSLLRQEVAA